MIVLRATIGIASILMAIASLIFAVVSANA